MIFLVSIWVILLIPFQVIGHGFMPPDDAMRHSAKIISGKDWNQILVLRDDIKLDSYPGWHAILGLVHRITGCGQHGLVLFSVVSLFVLFCGIPLFFLKFPESWLLSIFTLSIIAPGWILRLFLGRPYIVTMVSLLLIFFIYPRLSNKKFQYINFTILTAITALSIWIHASWYFFILLIISFILARQWRASILMAISCITGIFLGASLTGHPILFIKQMIIHMMLVFGTHDVARQLVSELLPVIGDFRVPLVIIIMLGWRAVRSERDKKSVDNPIFILIILAFMFGFISNRIWLDWGMASLAVWVAKEFDEFFKAHINLFSGKRAILAAVSIAFVFLSLTADAGSRWSLMRPMDYISSEDPIQAQWLPGKGGIIYSNEMGVFYQIFYKNPRADWRYILGFESAFMPHEDLMILRNIQKNFCRPEDFAPWVKKMRPEDRLIIRRGPDSAPKIKGLDWHYIALNTWSGRKPKGTSF